MSDWRQAVHYRNRAELLRHISDEIDHDEFKQALRRVADHYEKMACALDWHSKGE